MRLRAGQSWLKPNDAICGKQRAAPTQVLKVMLTHKCARVRLGREAIDWRKFTGCLTAPFALFPTLVCFPPANHEA